MEKETTTWILPYAEGGQNFWYSWYQEINPMLKSTKQKTQPTSWCMGNMREGGRKREKRKGLVKPKIYNPVMRLQTPLDFQRSWEGICSEGPSKEGLTQTLPCEQHTLTLRSPSAWIAEHTTATQAEHDCAKHSPNKDSLLQNLQM